MVDYYRVFNEDCRLKIELNPRKIDEAIGREVLNGFCRCFVHTDRLTSAISWAETSRKYHGTGSVPHELGSGQRSGKGPAQVVVPPHLPDNSVKRNDIVDYDVEVERFDSNVERALNLLAKTGLLDNTIVVVTSDQGMPFPRAKASLCDYGSRVPLAVCWPRGTPAGRTVDDFISLSDMALTYVCHHSLEVLYNQ